MSEPDHIDPSRLRPGPIRHGSSPPELLEQIKAVYDVVGKYLSITLEQFEIGYMPAFKLHGMLVYFAAWKKHIGLYPPVSGDKALEKAVARYAGPKGNLQFPLDQPIPYDLIKPMVTLRVTQDSARAEAVRKKRK